MPSSNTPFVLPTGAVVDTTDGTLSISYDGDIILEQSASLPLGRVQAGGDILLRMDHVQGTIIAGGRLIINGSVDAEWLHGSEIHISRRVFQESSIRSKYITALKRVVICESALISEMMLAPKLEIDKKSTGVVSVLDSFHPVDVPDIKGKIALKAHQDAFGNIETLIEEDGLHAFFSTKIGARFLAKAKGEHFESTDEIQTDYSDISEADEGVDDSYFDDTGIDDTSVGDLTVKEGSKNPFFQRPGDPSVSIISDDTNVSEVDDARVLEQLKRPSEPSVEDPEVATNDQLVVIERNHGQSSGSNAALHAELTVYLDALLALYPSPPPAPIETVKNHIHSDKIASLRPEMITIWRDLVTWHKSTKTPPNKKTADLFKKINNALKRS